MSSFLTTLITEVDIKSATAAVKELGASIESDFFLAGIKDAIVGRAAELVLETEGRVYGSVETSQDGVFKAAFESLVKEGKLTKEGERISLEKGAADVVQARTKSIMELNDQVVSELQRL